MSSLKDLYISDSYDGLLHAGGDPIPSTGQGQIYDGSGETSALKLGRTGNGAAIDGLLTASSISTPSLKVGPLNYPNVGVKTGNVAIQISPTTIGLTDTLPSSLLADLKPSPAGTYNVKTMTVNSKGLVTNVINASSYPLGGSNGTYDGVDTITVNTDGLVTNIKEINLQPSPAGTYNKIIDSITVNKKGQVTKISESVLDPSPANTYTNIIESITVNNRGNVTNITETVLNPSPQGTYDGVDGFTVSKNGLVTAVKQLAPNPAGTFDKIKSITTNTRGQVTNIDQNLNQFVGSGTFTAPVITFVNGVITNVASTVVTAPDHGMEVFHAMNNGPFTVPLNVYNVKFYVTAAGATGGNRVGGAGATAIGYMSVTPGQVYDVVVGIVSNTSNSKGGDSYIARSGQVIATADGGDKYTGVNGASQAYVDTSVVTSYILIPGGNGNIDTNSDNEESVGCASYWGVGTAYGGGGSSEEGASKHYAGQGVVIFEW